VHSFWRLGALQRWIYSTASFIHSNLTLPTRIINLLVCGYGDERSQFPYPTINFKTASKSGQLLTLEDSPKTAPISRCRKSKIGSSCHPSSSFWHPPHHLDDRILIIVASIWEQPSIVGSLEPSKETRMIRREASPNCKIPAFRNGTHFSFSATLRPIPVQSWLESRTTKW
jgi:hypothetical protein